MQALSKNIELYQNIKHFLRQKSAFGSRYGKVSMFDDHYDKYYNIYIVNMVFEYAIAALLIEMIIFLSYFRRRILPSSQNTVYIIILSILIATTILDLITGYVELNFKRFSILFMYVIECLYYSFTLSLPFSLAVYSMTVLDLFDILGPERSFKVKVNFLIPFIAYLIIIWLTLALRNVYPLCFIIDHNTGYRRNNSFWFYGTHMLSYYNFVFSLLLSIKYRRSIDKEKLKLLVLYVLTLIITSLLQFFNYGLMIDTFGMSLVMLAYFINIQKYNDWVDPVTKIFNQRSFIKEIDHISVAKAEYACVSVVIDDILFVTNTFGLNILNQVLYEVGEYLRKNFSTKNTFCVNQGVFCVIIKNPTDEKISHVVADITNRFRKPWVNETSELKLYTRICITRFPRDAKKSDDVLDIINLFTNDERYRAPLLYANEIDIEYKKRAMYIEHALKNGLAENRFDVYYQPIYSVAEKSLIGAEALIRLKDKDGKFISPEDFIPIAEKSGTIMRIGEYVFESVCLNLSQINTEEYGIKKIDINLSVVQCMDEVLAEQILRIQNSYSIPASLINLEITETAAAHAPDILLKNVQNLSDAGFEISLDDYGSGYSNMSYMLNLPFKMIKIDKYIVWAAVSDKRAETALAATIKMIKTLGMSVLAEGVEKKEQADWLIKLGCDYLQGFYYSKPICRKDFLEIMKKNKEKLA